MCSLLNITVCSIILSAGSSSIRKYNIWNSVFSKTSWKCRKYIIYSHLQRSLSLSGTTTTNYNKIIKWILQTLKLITSIILRKCIFAVIVQYFVPDCFLLPISNMWMFQIEPPSFFECQIWRLSSFKALSVTLGNVSSKYVSKCCNITQFAQDIGHFPWACAM